MRCRCLSDIKSLTFQSNMKWHFNDCCAATLDELKNGKKWLSGPALLWISNDFSSHLLPKEQSSEIKRGQMFDTKVDCANLVDRLECNSN